MTARVLILMVVVALFGCSNSASYEEGRQMADETYGAMPPEQMMAKMDSVLRQMEPQDFGIFFLP